MALIPLWYGLTKLSSINFWSASPCFPLPANVYEVKPLKSSAPGAKNLYLPIFLPRSWAWTLENSFVALTPLLRSIISLISAFKSLPELTPLFWVAWSILLLRLERACPGFVVISVSVLALLLLSAFINAMPSGVETKLCKVSPLSIFIVLKSILAAKYLATQRPVLMFQSSGMLFLSHPINCLSDDLDKAMTVYWAITVSIMSSNLASLASLVILELLTSTMIFII